MDISSYELKKKKKKKMEEERCHFDEEKVEFFFEAWKNKSMTIQPINGLVFLSLSLWTVS